MSDIPRTAPGRAMNGEDRRRIVELAASRRPDLHLEALHAMLLELGVDVDTDTLVADLDALGYEVEAPPDHDAAAPRPGEADPVADGGAGAVAHVEPTSAGWRAHPSVLVAVAVAVVALLAVAVLALTGDDGDDEAEVRTSGSTAPESTSDSTAEVSSTTEVRTSPAGDGLDPGLVRPGVAKDEFARPGPELGEVPGIGEWQAPVGGWTVTDEQLVLAEPEPEEASLALFDPGSGDVRAQVRLRRRGEGSGLAFRVRDEQNFFLWATAPYFGIVVLLEVVDGERTVLLDSGLAPTTDGMPSLGVNIVGSTVELLFQGAVSATYDDLPPVEGRERIGLGMVGGVEQPIFDDLLVLPGG